MPFSACCNRDVCPGWWIRLGQQKACPTSARQAFLLHRLFHRRTDSCVNVCYSKAGITEVFEGHHGPVTGLSCHSAGGPVDFSHLFISSSFDWTVKLWSTKVTHLHSRQHNDYLGLISYPFSVLYILSQSPASLLDAYYCWKALVEPLTLNSSLLLLFLTEHPPIVLFRGQL